MGNNYIQTQKQMQQYYFDQGEAVGFQRCLDYMQTILRNPKYMGKDTFGRKKSGRSQTRQWAVYEDEVGDEEDG